MPTFGTCFPPDKQASFFFLGGGGGGGYMYDRSIKTRLYFCYDYDL